MERRSGPVQNGRAGGRDRRERSPAGSGTKMAARKNVPDEAGGRALARSDALTKIRPVDDTEEHLLDDIQCLKCEISRARPGHESGLLRLYTARVAPNSTFEFSGLLDARGINWESNYTSIRGAG